MLSILILVMTVGMWLGLFFLLPVWMEPSRRALIANGATLILLGGGVAWRWRTVRRFWRIWLIVLFLMGAVVTGYLTKSIFDLHAPSGAVSTSPLQ